MAFHNEDAYESEDFECGIENRIQIIHVDTEHGHRADNTKRNEPKQHGILSGRWPLFRP